MVQQIGFKGNQVIRPDSFQSRSRQTNLLTDFRNNLLKGGGGRTFAAPLDVSHFRMCFTKGKHCTGALRNAVQKGKNKQQQQQQKPQTWQALK